MLKEKIVKILVKDKSLNTEDILRKIYQILNPDLKQKIVNSVEFPHGLNNKHINIKLNPEADEGLIKKKLIETAGISLKE